MLVAHRPTRRDFVKTVEGAGERPHRRGDFPDEAARRRMRDVAATI